MRIFLLSLLILVHVLYLSSPTAGTTLDSGGTDTGVRMNHGDTEGSGDTIKASSWSSFLDPSSIIESMQNAYLPSALCMSGAVQAFVASGPSPSDLDFWETAKKYEDILQEYASCLLKSAAAYFKSIQFTDVTSAMHHIVNATTTFRDSIKDALAAHHITFDMLTEELDTIFMTIVNDLKKIPPPDKAPGHAERAEMVDKILDDATLALTNLASRYGIEEEVVTTYLSALKPHVHALTVAVGDINEQHPRLLPILVFCVVILLLPESWILRPFLRLFGFGPAGPVKGSIAAWSQSYFWGAAVESGSWFSSLQAAGMGVIPEWAGLIKVPLLAGGLQLLERLGQ